MFLQCNSSVRRLTFITFHKKKLRHLRSEADFITTKLRLSQLLEFCRKNAGMAALYR